MDEIDRQDENKEMRWSFQMSWKPRIQMEAPRWMFVPALKRPVASIVDCSSRTHAHVYEGIAMKDSKLSADSHCNSYNSKAKNEMAHEQQGFIVLGQSRGAMQHVFSPIKDAGLVNLPCCAEATPGASTAVESKVLHAIGRHSG